MTISLKRILFSPLTAWFVVTLFGIYFVLNLRQNLNFGIDLVGGTYITVEVKTDALIEHEKAMRGSSGKPLTEGEIQEIIKNAVHDNIEVLRSRLDKSGVGEVTIAAHGEKNILIELPNVHNPEQAKAMIGKSALLEVKVVDAVADSQEELLKKYNGVVPVDKIVVKEVKEGDYARRPVTLYYLVPKYTDLTGKLLKTAHAEIGNARGLSMQPIIIFEFKAEGAEKFYQLTKKNIGKSIALILDNEVITAPRVSVAIRDRGQIEGDFDMQHAKDVALMLRAGAFTAPVEVVEERHIGPSLGEAAVRQGVIACVIGLVLLFLFSLFFYKMAGLFAFIVLLYNLLLILFALSWFQAALTLPGIAGIVLSIGMAIDASILIYERIKELLASGASLKKAVDEGFSGALAVILDANITHFLVAVVLYYLGAGPIQGFAVTMIIGIIATLLTGLLLLRALFDFYISTLGIQKIWI